MATPITLPNFGLPAFRPPNWSAVNTTAIIVPANTLPNVTSANGEPLPNSGFTVGATLLVFDVVPRIEHRQEVTKTTHPIQTGANITDHAYIEPARVVLEIGMSDAVDSFQPGMWTASPSKSVSAYQALLAILKSRRPVQITTRLQTYQNMLLRTLTPIESAETRYGLRAAASFEEVLTASVTLIGGGSSGLVDSLRPQATDENSTGTVQTVPPSASLIGQNNVSEWPPAASYPYVPGAGNWSSNPTVGIPAQPLSNPGALRVRII